MINLIKDTRTLYPKITARAHFSTSIASKNAYKFYDLVVASQSQKVKADKDSPVIVSGSTISIPLSTNVSHTFDTRYKKDSKDIDIETVFGGNSKNKSTKSSRRDVSYRLVSKKIAGVTVPKRPIEPDNCCMSGCINCVWDLFNEDLEEWKNQTNLAVNALSAQDKNNIKYKWPLNFDPPPKHLSLIFVPDELKKTGQDQITPKYEMPLGLQVLANLEKKLKSKHEHKTDDTVDHKLDTSLNSKSSSSSNTATPPLQ
ncbi:hypothetical protein B5S33_g25 [[Candida] boidinii]|nr:hypothetical protein B5S33_g25 [[Candida] boidinii]